MTGEMVMPDMAAWRIINVFRRLEKPRACRCNGRLTFRLRKPRGRENRPVQLSGLWLRNKSWLWLLWPHGWLAAVCLQWPSELSTGWLASWLTLQLSYQ